MCLIAFAYNTHPQYQLILVANRDEYYQRESTVMHWWSEDLTHARQNLLAGRDEVGGGTWFGVNRSGAWAALTNFRESGGDRKEAKTRGELVTAFLMGQQSPTQFVNDLQRNSQDFNGFNLLLADGQNIVCFNNRMNEAKMRTERLLPGGPWTE